MLQSSSCPLVDGDDLVARVGRSCKDAAGMRGNFTESGTGAKIEHGNCPPRGRKGLPSARSRLVPPMVGTDDQITGTRRKIEKLDDDVDRQRRLSLRRRVKIPYFDVTTIEGLEDEHARIWSDSE